MTPKDFAALAGALAWPLTTIGFLAVFHKPIRVFLDRLAAAISIKSIKVKAFGIESELTVEQAKNALNELLQDIAESTNELLPEDSQLFGRIIASAGRETVVELIPNFKRDSAEHQRLRLLRDRKLVRPAEGGNWQPEKHPRATRFGQLVYDLRNAQPPQKPG